LNLIRIMPAKGAMMTQPNRVRAARDFRLISKSTPGAMFASPAPAGRRITAGFSWLQRIGKSAAVDVWFPDCLKQKLDTLIACGKTPGPGEFPAEWAAVRQFELLQEAGNYKIYDLNAEHLMRTLHDITRNMRGGGYRVTVATIGSYAEENARDELEILDRRLQERISAFINMLYLEEQSGKINAALAASLREEKWDLHSALPHVGVTLGARDLFRPHGAAAITVKHEACLVPGSPHAVAVAHAAGWIEDRGVIDAISEKKFMRVSGNPQAGQYAVQAGIYRFAAADAWKDVLVSYRYGTGASEMSGADRRHRLARHFFKILGMLPQNHIVHETAIGLQLPESISENQWIYIAPDGEKVGDFIRLMDNLFAPFNKISLAGLDGRAGAGTEIKSTVSHMQGYGDRLRPGADQFYRGLAALTVH
jgi:hypothetical protein